MFSIFLLLPSPVAPLDCLWYVCLQLICVYGEKLLTLRLKGIRFIKHFKILADVHLPCCLFWCVLAKQYQHKRHQWLLQAHRLAPMACLLACMHLKILQIENVRHILCISNAASAAFVASFFLFFLETIFDICILANKFIMPNQREREKRNMRNITFQSLPFIHRDIEHV